MKTTEQRKKKTPIFVGVPCTGGRIGIGVQAFLHGAERASLDPSVPYSFAFQLTNDKRPVEYARNVLVGTFLRHSKAERLWFIDDDMIPPPNALEMLDVDADIVVAIAFAFDHKGPRNETGLKLCAFKYNLRGDHKFNSIVPTPETPRYVKIDAGGTATMVIKRRVLEDKRLWLDGSYVGLDDKPAELPDEIDESEFAPPIFRTVYKPNGRILRGEDLDFCLRATRLGYKAVVDLGVRFGHVKPVNLDEVATLMMKVADRAQNGRPAMANITEKDHANTGEVDRQTREAAAADGSGGDGGRPPGQVFSGAGIGGVGGGRANPAEDQTSHGRKPSLEEEVHANRI